MTRPKRFNKGPIEHRMIQAWIILVGKAHSRQTINYAALARLMGSNAGKRDGQWKGLQLGKLYTYCDDRGLPLLPVIVVTKKTGLPADMAPYFPANANGREPNAERESVFNFDWYGRHPPCESDIPE